jgi:hypothetical protein
MGGTEASKAAATLGSRGGRCRSPAQTAARRSNGKKGGRPKKIRPEPPADDIQIEDLPAEHYAQVIEANRTRMIDQGVLYAQDADLSCL